MNIWIKNEMKFAHLLHRDIMGTTEADISLTLNQFNRQFWKAILQKGATSLLNELSTIVMEKVSGANVFNALFRLPRVFKLIKVRIKCNNRNR